MYQGEFGMRRSGGANATPCSSTPLLLSPTPLLLLSPTPPLLCSPLAIETYLAIISAT